MSVSALFLFGSRARGDNSTGSDIDLLAVSNVSKPMVTGAGPATLYHYNSEWLRSKARQGDLFIWHIVTEALAVFDPNDVLPELQNEFRFSQNYESQILKGSEVGWAIASLWGDLSAASINKKLAWSVRTIAIARAASSRRPAFSAQALAETLDYPNIVSLVGQKDEKHLSEKSLTDFVAFLDEFGFSRRCGDISSIDEYTSYFSDTQNEVGLKLLELQTSLSSYT